MSPETYSEPGWMSMVEFFAEKLADFSHWLFRKDLYLMCWPVSECTSYVNFDVAFWSVSSLIFLSWSLVKYMRGSFLRKWLADFRGWLFLRESFILDVAQFSECISECIFCKQTRLSKISSHHQSLHYNFDLNQNWRRVSIPLYWARIGLSLMQKWKFHDFSVKSSNFFDRK